MIGKFFQKYWKLAIALTVSLIVILGISYSISGFKEFTNALVAWGTLMLAFATFMLIRHSSEQERRRRRREILNKINKWSVDVLTLCASVGLGYNTQEQRGEAKEKYLTLKYAGENLLTSVENENCFLDLLTHLRDANNCFDSASYNTLQDNNEKREKLETSCRYIQTQASNLLRKQ